MTQSKKDDEYTITLDSGETIDLSGIVDTTGDITINLNDYNMGTTTTYWAGDSVTDITLDTGSSSGIFTLTNNDTITITDGLNSSHTLSSDWISNNVDVGIDLNSIFGETFNEKEIERMCKQYPGLEKVWRNFKSVYDMCKQDFEGKKKAGEIDDDIPF